MQGTGVSCELMFITRLCPTLCDLMGCSTPGIPVPYCLLEFAQVYIHCISDAIQPSHSLMPSSPSALNLSKELFQWVICLHQMTKILELQLQHQSFQRIFRVDPLRLTDLIFLLSKGLSGALSSTTVQRHQFFGVLPSWWSSSHNCVWPLGRP